MRGIDSSDGEERTDKMIHRGGLQDRNEC